MLSESLVSGTMTVSRMIEQNIVIIQFNNLLRDYVAENLNTVLQSQKNIPYV